jgi:hypothetical protein
MFRPLRQRLILWRGRLQRIRIPVALTVAVIVLTFVLTTLAAVPILSGHRILDGADQNCAEAPFSCGVVTGVFFTVLALALAFASFVIWRVRWVARGYVQTAVKRPTELVETASSMEVVGRDELCEVIEQNLCAERRPHLLVGGMGAGKTAVMVRLTQMLAKSGAIPIPIQLRDPNGSGNASASLDFRSLAHERFVAAIEPMAFGPDEAEKIWRSLKEDGSIVILADGLEQALLGLDDEEERTREIRLAIDQARRTEVPLVMASRPDPMLRDLDTAVIRLEPLPLEAAVEHVRSGAKDADVEKVRKLAEAAEIVEMPFYLRLAGDLAPQQLVDVEDNTRLTIRVALLERWMEEMLKRTPLAQLGLRSARERDEAMKTLGLMACASLESDSLELSF